MLWTADNLHLGQTSDFNNGSMMRADVNEMQEMSDYIAEMRGLCEWELYTDPSHEETVSNMTVLEGGESALCLRARRISSYWVEGAAESPIRSVVHPGPSERRCLRDPEDWVVLDVALLHIGGSYSCSPNPATQPHIPTTWCCRSGDDRGYPAKNACGTFSRPFSHTDFWDL